MSDTSHDSTAPDDTAVRLTVWLTGEVQGVGMRWWVRSRALELGLAGSASNRSDGRVEVVAEGSRRALEALLGLLEPGAVSSASSASSRPGRVNRAVQRWDVARGGVDGFRER